MGAEIPSCCEMSCVPVPQEAETNDTCTTLNKEAQEKFNGTEKPMSEPETTITNPANLTIQLPDTDSAPSSHHSKKKRRHHKHKKKKRSHNHHAQKLKYKQSKRTQSCQVYHANGTGLQPTDEDECEDQEERILSTQYQLLNAQNQLFIGKHATYFAETYNDQDAVYSVYSNDSFDSVPSIQTNSSIPSTQTHVSHPGSMSPLCTLSGNHANIILSYSDLSSPRSKPHSRARSYSVPVTPQRSRSEETDCECVDECMAIQRVIDALRWYSRFGNNSELLMQNVADIYEYLVDDYQHILHKHLTQQLEINMGMEYAVIKSKMEREITPCEKRTCKGHRRYKHYKQNKGFAGECAGDPFLTFMDSMHCFFMHSGDL